MIASQLTPDDVLDFLLGYVDEHRGRVAAQHFFTLLHRVALEGLGVGWGDAIEESGEWIGVEHAAAVARERHPDEPHVVFDVGANVGDYARLCRRCFGAAPTRYFSFEPSPTAFAALCENTHHIAELTPLNIAISDRPGEALLFADREGSVLASLFKRRLDHFQLSFQAAEPVTVRTLDQIAADLAIERINFLKLDIEGAEFAALCGARRLLDDGRIDVIQFEFGGTSIDARTFLQDFWYLLRDYRIGRVLRDGIGWIDHYSEAEEMFRTQNFIAELR